MIHASEIINILEYVRDNKGADTKNLNNHVVKDLYKMGYLDGTYYPLLSGAYYFDSRLTILGAEYLDSLLKPKTKQNKAMQPSENVSSSHRNNGRNSSWLVKFSIMVLAGVFVLLVGWVIKHYFLLNIG